MVTDNRLGIGGLLSDAFQVAQLMAKGYFSQTGLLAILPDASLADLEPAVLEGFLKPPADVQGGSVFGKLRDAEVFRDQRGTVVELIRKLGIRSRPTTDGGGSMEGYGWNGSKESRSSRRRTGGSRDW